MDIRKVFLGGLVASAVFLPATAASASVIAKPHQGPGPVPGPTWPGPLPQQQSFTATAPLTSVPDVSTGAGTWAYDSVSQKVTITEDSVTNGPGNVRLYHYSVVVSETGSFTTASHALTPNQGRPYAGRHITGTVRGSLSGTADYTFTATSLPSNQGVARLARTTPQSGNTTNWLKQAFPGGSVSGVTDGAWTRTYTAQAPNGGPSGYWHTYRVYRHRHWVWVRTWVPAPRYQPQQWVDSSANGQGQLHQDGNITGF